MIGKAERIATLDEKIGYVRKTSDDGGYEYIEASIKSMLVSEKGGTIYTDVLGALDREKLERTTKWLNDTPHLVLVNEPFITNLELARRHRSWCANRILTITKRWHTANEP